MAVFWLRRLRSQLLGRFQLRSAHLLLRSAMRFGHLCRVRAMFGLMGTGDQMTGIMSGFRERGGGLRLTGLTGAIRITTITTMAGTCMRAIGTMKTMAIIMMIITTARFTGPTSFHRLGRFLLAYMQERFVLRMNGAPGLGWFMTWGFVDWWSIRIRSRWGWVCRWRSG
jgi:hypothetical protein